MNFTKAETEDDGVSPASQEAVDRLSSRAIEGTKHAIGYLLAGAIVTEFIFFFLGVRAFAPFLLIWAAVGLGAVVFLNGSGRVYHWIQLFWLFAMAGLLGSCIVSYLDNRTGATYVARWALSYAPAAFLPLLAGLITPRWIYRAASVLGIQALLYSFLIVVAMKAGVNPHYRSPIPPVKVLPPEYFRVLAYSDELTGAKERRPVAFSPYATFSGAIGCFYLLLTLGDRRSLLRWLGMSGWMCLVILSASRTALLCTTLGLILFYLLLIPRRYLLVAVAVGMIVSGAVFQPLFRLTETVVARINDFRPTSSEVRQNLRQIAYDEWDFGNRQLMGVNKKIPGGRVVADMLVGSHDTINSTLMTRGALGLCLLLSPLVITFVFSLVAGFGVSERICAASMVALGLYTHTEGLEALFMFIWPVFLVVGFACKNHALRMQVCPR